MYLVSGWLTIAELAISSSVSGLRRQACGLRAPLRNAFAATLARVAADIPYSCMYRWIFMPKNWVVSIRPVSPYQRPRPLSSGSALNAPGGCLSKPMAMTRSWSPDRMARSAMASALPPVAHPLRTLMNGKPVRPRSLTSVSAFPAARLPPNAHCTSAQPIPASASAWRAA